MRHRKVTLDAVGSCAMMHAFLRHPASVRELANGMGRFTLLCEVFQNSLGLVFTSDAQMTVLYRAFAKAEIVRLHRPGDARLLCRHGQAVHVQALEVFLSALPEPVTN